MRQPHVLPSQSQPVLVLDGNRVSALAIVRSLGRKGLRVEVGAADANPLASRSRYCHNHFVYPDPMRDVPGFRRAIEERLAHVRYALVIPVTDETIVPLMEVRDSIERLAPLAMASNEAIHTTLSKIRTTELASRLGVPTPRSRVIRDLAEAPVSPEEMSFPLVIKPDRTKVWTAHGEVQDLSVSYAEDPVELTEWLSILLPSGPVLLQEKVVGPGVGLGVLASGGEILFLFQYRRLHEVPLTGGASSYRISESLDPELAGYAALLIEALSWDGVVMLEFKRSPSTGKAWLIEINGRFWGSLPLPVAAGADFPAYLFDLWIDGRRDFPATYRVGTRCRSERREIGWLRLALAALKHGVAGSPRPRQITADCLRMLNPAERWDILSFTDPVPGVTEIRSLGGKVVRRFREELKRAAVRRRMRQVRNDPVDLTLRLQRARRILILCRGNIMRSPFAAALLERTDSGTGLEFRSAGLECWPGKPADPMAVAEANRRKIDLSSHLATPLTHELAAWADVIFALETWHLIEIEHRFPEAAGKSFLLSCLVPELPLDIADPAFERAEVFARCFDLIETAVAPIAGQLRAAEAPPRDVSPRSLGR